MEHFFFKVKGHQVHFLTKIFFHQKQIFISFTTLCRKRFWKIFKNKVTMDFQSFFLMEIYSKRRLSKPFFSLFWEKGKNLFSKFFLAHLKMTHDSKIHLIWLYSIRVTSWKKNCLKTHIWLGLCPLEKTENFCINFTFFLNGLF